MRATSCLLTLTKHILVLTAHLTFLTAALGQGSLTPPASPGATMKTLQQIEPRADLQSEPPPFGVSTASPDYEFVITEPGSYYLSRNLGATKPSAIRILAEDVTLDLNGFEIFRN